jgi:hypothetical protein
MNDPDVDDMLRKIALRQTLAFHIAPALAIVVILGFLVFMGNVGGPALPLMMVAAFAYAARKATRIWR